MDDGRALARGLHSAEEGGPIRQVNEQAEIAMGRSLVIERVGRPVELIRSPGGSCGACMTTIHVEVSFLDSAWPDADDAQRQFALLGRLSWGQAGASFSAAVDVHQGVAFSLVASFVALDVGFDPQSNNAENSRIARVDVSAALVWGTSPGRPFPTRTLRGVIPDNDGQPPQTLTLRVPQWAYALQLATPRNAYFSETFADQRITFHSGPLPSDDPILDVSPADIGFQALTFDGIKLPEGVHYVTFTNLSIVDATPLRVVFPLNL